jgi:hypothetical protein
MAKNWKKMIAPLTLAFAAALGLAGCDSQADIDAKPRIMQQMVQNSASVCTPAQGQAAAYSARLNDALGRAGAGDLRTLSDNHITICLDQRLDNQNTGFWDTKAQGVLARDADGKGGTITIWDNGRQPQDGGFFHATAGNFSYYILHTFAGHLKDGDVKPGSRWIAYDSSYSDSNGTYIQDSSARPEAKFDKDTRAKNPWLTQAPVVTPAPRAPQPKGPGA